MISATSKGPSIAVYTDPMFSAVATPYRDYVRSVARAMRLEVEALPLDDGFRRSIERRAINLVNCIAKVSGYECEECGQPAEASGELLGAGAPCQARTCPRCARRRAATYRDLGERLQRTCTPILPGWSWKMITVTGRYDKTSEDDLTIPALRRRWAGFRAAFRGAFDYLRELAGEDAHRVGALCAVQMQGDGNVHLHAIALCPLVDKDQLEMRAALGWGGSGFVKVNEVDPAAIAEVCKYPVAGPGSAAEAWLGGAKYYVKDKKTGGVKPGLVHPRLAARWELALYGRRVLERYGSFRKVPLAGEKSVTEKAIVPAACLCGANHWRHVVCSLREWIFRFTGTGQSALATPRAIRARDGDSHGRTKREIERDRNSAAVGDVWIWSGAGDRDDAAEAAEECRREAGQAGARWCAQGREAQARNPR